VAAEGVVQVELTPQYSQISRTGESFIMGVKFSIKPGWHIYWRNPGDSGAPPAFQWTESRFLSFSEPYWPPPKTMMVGPFINIGYEKKVTIPIMVNFKGSTDVSPTSIPIDGHVEYLACKEECIPGSSELHLDLTLGDISIPSDFEAEVNDSYDRSAHETPIQLMGEVSNNTIHVLIPEKLRPFLPIFLPHDSGIIDLAHPPKNSVENHISVKLDNSITEKYNAALKEDEYSSILDFTGHSLKGDVVLNDGRAVSVSVNLAVDTAPDLPLQTEVPDSTPIETTDNDTVPATRGLFLLCLYALIGGIILNCMPCVFPIIGIKVLQFTNCCHGDRRVILKHGISFSGGIIVSMWILSGILILLRELGTHTGWGFQLQYPPFVLVLIFLFSFLSAHLLGMVTFGEQLQITAARVDGGKGLFGSFSSGVLATLVATPCSAPFMGTAIGAALTLPDWQGLLIFTALGLGVSLPFLLLCAFPEATYWLPKPGPWMEVLKELLAFPLLATVIWLLYVLGIQTNLHQVIFTLGGLLSCVLGFFLREKMENARWHPGARLLIFYILLGTGLYFATFDLIRSTNSTRIIRSGEFTPLWRPYDKLEIARLQAADRPVFIDFTAAWCITCQLNKKTVLESKDILKAFESFGVTLFRADWTSSDDEITKALSELGRQSVPVNVLLWKKKQYIFPTVLTKDAILLKLTELQEE
jgi:thiol:disulfide interchange protein DsbD